MDTLRKLVNVIQFMCALTLSPGSSRFLLASKLRYKIIDSENELEQLDSSLIRWGDGETEFCLGAGLGFQSYDDNLSNELIQILRESGSLHCPWILGVPYGSMDPRRRARLSLVSRANWFRTSKLLDRYLVPQTVVDAFMFRPKNIPPLRPEKAFTLSQIASAFANYHVVFIGPEHVLEAIEEVHNDVFRVQTLSIDAYSEIGKYQQQAMEHLRQNDNSTKTIVFVSAGPTGKALVRRLALRGIKAIDIGSANISRRR